MIRRAALHRAAAAALAAAAVMTSTAAARANGATAHAWIAQHAIEHLPDGELRRMLDDPELRLMLINGAVFPDGGYIIDDDYGEMAHWEPFVNAYIAWARDTLPRPFTRGPSAEQVAFLLGVAAHGLADQTFDSMFMPAARIHDAAGWSEDLFDGHDTATDVMLADQTGENFGGLDAWVPADDLSALFQSSMGYTVSADDLYSTQGLIHRITLAYAPATLDDPGKVADYYTRYPWSGDNLLDDTEPGAPPCQAEIIAAYWQAVWDRLHDVADPANFVIATYPRDGSLGHPIDRSQIESQVIIVLGHGVDTARFQGHVEVRDDGGHVYEVELTSPWATEVTNVLRILPQEDWADAADFTVTVSPPIETIDGLALDQPFSFTFSTDPAPPSDPTDDPTPHVGEPDVGGSGGCSAGTGAGGLLVAVAVALAVLGLRRRGAAVLLLLLLPASSGCSAGPDGDRFRVVFIADTHIAGPQYECCTESNDLDNASIVRTEERLRDVVDRINAITPAPDLVFVLGDVMHNPYYSLDPDWYYAGDSAWTIAPALLADLAMPVYPAWGNHDYDVRCTGEHVGRDLTHQLFDHYFQAAPYYAVDHKGWRFVLGNSQLGATWDPTDPGCDTDVGSYGAEQLAWIDDQLADGRPSVFMSHYMLDVTATQEVPATAAPDVETVLGQHANLALHIAGHTHHWLDFLDAYPFAHVIIGATRYDADNFWLVEFDGAGGFQFLDYDKAGRFSGCADTWTYDGDPAYLEPQPAEDGDC